MHQTSPNTSILIKKKIYNWCVFKEACVRFLSQQQRNTEYVTYYSLMNRKFTNEKKKRLLPSNQITNDSVNINIGAYIHQSISNATTYHINEISKQPSQIHRSLFHSLLVCRSERAFVATWDCVCDIVWISACMRWRGGGSHRTIKNITSWSYFALHRRWNVV